MARKDFELYYDKIRRQYFQLLDSLKEADKLATEKVVDQQVLDNLTAIMQPVKNSYMSLAYVEYLLNLPKNKKVQKRNERQFKAILDKIDPSKKQDNVLKDNQKTMTEVNKLIDKELR